MEYKTLKDFLFGEGYLDGNHTGEEIKMAKKMWEQEREKAYQRAYKKRHHRKELLFTKEEWKLLETARKKHNKETKHMTQFLKICVFAYLEKGFILPNEYAVQSAEIEVRRVGVLINQIARHVNTVQYVLDSDVQQLQEHFLSLEEFVQETLRTPKTIEDLLDDYGTNVSLLDHLEKLIQQKRSEL